MKTSVTHKFKRAAKKRFADFTFFFGYLRYRVFFAIVLSLVVGVIDGIGLTLFLPLLQMIGGADSVNGEFLGRLRFVTDWIEAAGIHLTLYSVLILMVVFFLGKSIIMYLGLAYKIKLNQLFIKRVRKDLLRNFNAVNYKYFVQSDVGRIQNSMTGEVDRVAQAFQRYFKAAERVILVIIYTLFAFVVDPLFALLVFAGGFLTNLIYSRIYKRTKAKSKELTSVSHSYQGQIIQYVSNFKYLKATALIDSFTKKLDSDIDDIEYSRRKIGQYTAFLTASREGMVVLALVTVVFIQVVILKGSFEGILLSLLFFYRALSSLIHFQSAWNGYLEVSGSVENLKDFKRELKQNREEVSKEEFDGFQHEISLVDAGFSYGDISILNEVNLTIKKNETFAFVGESGSGKTTLVTILSGLMPVDSGALVIDGKNLNRLNSASYQKKIGYVTQDAVIFNDSIFNNISFWAAPTEENHAKFKRACELASIADFVDELPDKQHTLLGNNGINLSGGQKQRISIARELYKDIDILILDEATSALDSETEKSIQQNIDELKGKFTILIVAHRLSTIRNADQIVLMNKGKIVAKGTYTQLLKENRDFEYMVKLQEL